MFEKFGELNSFGEINELAENLFNEGDTESLRAMAKENGIQSDFVDMYLQGEIPALCDQLTAAKQIVKNLQRGPMNRQERRARERKLRPRKNPRKH